MSQFFGYFENDEIIKTILSYSNLKKGWDYGDGVPASNKSVKTAVSIYLIGNSYGFKSEPHPSVDGGINIIFSQKDSDDFLDILINPDGTIDVRHEKGRGVNFKTISDEENVNYNYVNLKFYELKNIACNTSDYLILTDTTPQRWGDLQVKHLENLKVEFQYFQPSVPKKKPRQYATT